MYNINVQPCTSQANGGQPHRWQTNTVFKGTDQQLTACEVKDGLPLLFCLRYTITVWNRNKPAVSSAGIFSQLDQILWNRITPAVSSAGISSQLESQSDLVEQDYTRSFLCWYIQLVSQLVRSWILNSPSTGHGHLQTTFIGSLRRTLLRRLIFTVQELCEDRGGRPGPPVLACSWFLWT